MLQPIHGSQPPPQWLSLTDLGRIYGISAVHCGRLLSEAGLRDDHSQPHVHGPTQWHRRECEAVFQRAGLEPIQRTTLVQQWAQLLSALTEGSPSISTSAAQMAEELPGELVAPVNAELRTIGCSFQVAERRRSRHSRQSSRRREERGTARPL